MSMSDHDLEFEWPERIPLIIRVDGSEFGLEQEYVRADVSVERERLAYVEAARIAEERDRYRMTLELILKLEAPQVRDMIASLPLPLPRFFRGHGATHKLNPETDDE